MSIRGIRGLCGIGVYGGGSVVVDLLFYVPPIVCGGSVLVFILYALLYVLSSFAIILMWKRELVALLLLSVECLVAVDVLRLFLTVPWVGLQFVIVVFPDHTHLLFVCFRFNSLGPSQQFFSYAGMVIPVLPESKN